MVAFLLRTVVEVNQADWDDLLQLEAISPGVVPPNVPKVSV